MAEVLNTTVAGDVECPFRECAGPVLKQRMGVRASNNQIVREWDLYVCSRGSNHLPLGWHPPQD